MRTVPIIGTTCLTAARSHLLRCRLFDVCILDEASQATLPVSLPPLLRSRTSVLVGDLYQLPPLVRSRAAEVRPQSRPLKSGRGVTPHSPLSPSSAHRPPLPSTCALQYHSGTVRRETVAMNQGMGSGRAGGVAGLCCSRVSETAVQAHLSL